MTKLPSIHLSLALLLLAGATGCAAKSAAPAASGPVGTSFEAEEKLTSAPAENDLAGLDQAALSFDEAEQELAGLMDGSVSSAADDDAADRAEERAPPPSPGEPAEPAQLARPSKSASNACTRACRALSSMKRSASRLCDLTGSDDPRCEDVSDRYERANTRVARWCSSCDG